MNARKIGNLPADLLREGHLLQPLDLARRAAAGKVAAQRAMDLHPIPTTGKGGEMVALAAMLRGNRRRRK